MLKKICWLYEEIMKICESGCGEDYFEGCSLVDQAFHFDSPTQSGCQFFYDGQSYERPLNKRF
jgi:hypothetical protein